MLDDKPRYGVSAHEMLFCEDLSDTIVQHMFKATVAAQRQRSERLVKALGIFNDGGKSLKDWWLSQSSPSMQRGSRRKEVALKTTDEKDGARFDHEFGVQEEISSSSPERSLTRDANLAPSASGIQPTHPSHASDGNKQASQDRTDNHVSGVDFQHDSAQASVGNSSRPSGILRSSTSERMSLPRKTGKKSRNFNKDFDAATQMHHAYGRASNLLREATGAFGVAFLDASAASAARPLDAPSLQQIKHGRSSSQSNTTRSPLATSDDSAGLTNSDTDRLENDEKRCKVVGRSVQLAPRNASAGKALPLHLKQRDIAKLIKSYPLGKVFNFAETGTPYSGSEDSAGSEVGSSGSALETEPRPPRANTRHNRHAQLLRKFVGSARSIAFFPIFDATNNRYRSCLFAWTLHANRFFDTQEDMTYFSAFGHSLRAEISRIETTASDVAKGKFISSISHELRSVFELNIAVTYANKVQ
jgi:hypothetical protein